MPNYYEKLPDDYVEVYQIDAKNKKTSLLLTLGSFVLCVGVIAIIYFLKGFSLEALQENANEVSSIMLYFGGFILAMILYIILHELTHGLFYKIFTHHKLTFGLTLSVAYCGVPDLYCSKKTMMITVLAPFVIWTLVILPFIIILPANILNVFVSLLFAIHVSGCIGDLFCACLMTIYPSNLLVNDTGPKQTFYLNKI